ncbi:MAG: Snf7 family protein [Candidatus Thorarchaeota archaeon]
MDSLRKAFRWGRKKPDIGEVSSQLRILTKQLARERNKLEKEERDTRARAIKARQAGQMDAFKTYATEMIRFRRFVLSTDKARLQILKILTHLNRAQTSARTGRALEEVAKILGMLGDTSDTRRLVENIDEITRRLDEFEIESAISAEALDASMEVDSDDIAAAMQEIDVEVGLADAASVAARPASESETLEKDIKDLERELGI